MSRAALKWARDLAIADGAMKPVLLELAAMHMEGRKLFPSQALLAFATGNSERTVRDALRMLEHFNIISRKARSNGAGGRTSDEYTLAIDTPFCVSRGDVSTARKALSNRRNLPVASGNSQPAKSAGGPGEICRGTDTLTEVSIRVEAVSDVEIGDTRDAGPNLRVIAGGRI